MQRVLFSDAHVIVTLDATSSLVRFKRTSQPYASLEVVRSVHAEVRRALRAEVKEPIKLLIDIRAAPARNDPAFEAEVVKTFQGLDVQFAAQVVLVQSAVGKLQAQRLARITQLHGGGEVVFADEAEALAFLAAARP